jgi:hypothetical protein
MVDETIIHLEAMWQRGLSFRKSDDYSPFSTLSPLLVAIALDWSSKYVYRQVHTVGNLKAWCSSISKAKGLGEKYIWLSGHGVSGRKAFRLHEGDRIEEVSVGSILDAIALAGNVAGVVIDSCSFGMHLEKNEKIPMNIPWIIAAHKDIDWNGSAFVFAKALEWMAYDRKKSPIERFRYAIRTDNERRMKARVNYSDLIKSMGIRIYCYRHRVFKFYPGDNDD